MVTHRRRLWFGAIGILLLVGGWIAFVSIRDAEKDALWLTIDVEQVGQVLAVFVDDNGRLPFSFDELSEKGYVERRTDGRLYPTEAPLERYVGTVSGHRGLPFHDLSEIAVQYGARAADCPIITLRKGAPGQAVHMAEMFSALILEKLNKSKAEVGP